MGLAAASVSATPRAARVVVLFMPTQVHAFSYVLHRRWSWRARTLGDDDSRAARVNFLKRSGRGTLALAAWETGLVGSPTRLGSTHARAPDGHFSSSVRNTTWTFPAGSRTSSTRDYMAAFFADYNATHRHSGLNYYTPDTVHEGRADQAHQRRQATLNACHARNPHRYRNKPTAPAAPAHAGINHKTNPLSQTA